MTRDLVATGRDSASEARGSAARAVTDAVPVERSRARTSAPPRRVLVLKPCCIGDVLMATPVLASLRAAWPEARIEWAVDRHSAPVLEGNPHLDGCLDATGCVRGDLSAAALWRLVRRVRAARFDAVFVPDRSPVLAWAARASGAPLRVGLASGWRGLAHSVRVAAPPSAPRHEMEVYLDLVRAIGLSPAPCRPVFAPTADHRAAAERVSVAAPNDGPWAALHPGGGVNPGMRLVEKRWPAERFASIAGRLVAAGAGAVFLLGGPDDRPLTEVVARGVDSAGGDSSRLLDVAGRLRLPEVGALVERCALFVGNDTGVTHLAAAVGTPVVAVFGPTDPARYGPMPDAGVAVAPRGGGATGPREAVGSTAIGAVPVADVWAAVARYLPR